MIQPLSQLRAALIAGLALFIGGMLALSGYTLWLLRADAIDNSFQISELQVRSFESFLTQNLYLAEMEAMSAVELTQGTLDLRDTETALTTTLRQAPFLRSLSLADENDRIVVSTNAKNVGIRVPLENYLPKALATLEILRIGAPWSGRDFADGKPATSQTPVEVDQESFIPVARPLTVGGRAMRLHIALNSGYLVTNMAQSIAPAEGVFEVLRYDGTLLISTDAAARMGSHDDLVVHDFRLDELERGKSLQKSGDGQRLLTAFRASHLYPVVVVTHRPEALALRTWNTQTKALLSVVIPALVVIALLVIEFLRRQRLFAARQAEADRLQQISATVFEASAAAIIITDLHANIIAVNPAFSDITGYSEADVVGKNPRMLSSGAQGKSFYEDMWTTLLREGVWHGEVLNLRKNGALYDARLSVTVSCDSAGNPQHFIGDLWDITESKHAEATINESRNLLLTIINTAPVRVFWKDLNLRYLGCNTAFTNDAGKASPAEVIGKTDFQMGWAQQAELYRADDFSVLRSGIPKLSYEEPQTTPDGKTIWLRTSKVPLKNIANATIGILGIYEDITEYKRTQSALDVSEERFRRVFYLTPDSLNINRLEDGLYVSINLGFTQITGYTEEDVKGRTSNEINIWNDPTDRQRLVSCLKRDGAVTNFEAVFRAKDGHTLHGLMSASVIDLDGVPHILNVTRDISVRKLAEDNMRLAASVFANSREGIMITAIDGTIIDVNDAFTNITGYTREEAKGNNPHILSSGRQGKEHYAKMWHDLIEKGHWYGEIWNRRKNGEVYAEMQTITTVRDAQGKPQHYVSLFSDISLYKTHQNQLEHIAHYDALTSLPNRVLLADRMQQGIAQVQRRKQLMAVAFLDLDGFKAINDVYGHEAGDQLLIALSSRMKQALREGDTLARLGGDEFVAVLLDLPEVETSVPMLTRLLAAVSQPVAFGDKTLQVSGSIGVTFYPQIDDVDADQMLRQADQAMYQAKLAGKNRYHVFDAEQDRSVRGHHEDIESIRLALHAQELVLYYQPKVNMRSGKVVGVEALIRWQHPERGLLLPGVFLPVIEDNPLSVAVGEWVIETALAQIARWKASGLHLPVSVNIGARQLQKIDFITRLHALLAQHPGMQPGDLELEVLETSALEDLGNVSRVIEECREMGVSFALDDFGTGYSSLTYLKQLPVTQLKIDQSFVRDMLVDPDDLAILEGIVGLASAFRRQVIAEGVETIEIGTMLLQLGCEHAQGYGIARPMPAQAIAPWIASWDTYPTWRDTATINRDAFPLLFASVEHRAWILTFESFLRGEVASPPPMDMHQCRLGHWLNSGELSNYADTNEAQRIHQLHHDVHALAARIADAHANGETPMVGELLLALHGTRDALLAQLQVLLQKHAH